MTTASTAGPTIFTLLRHSLLARLALVVTCLVIATSAALFFGIDHFISRQFIELREERLSRLSDRVREMIDEERHKFHGIAQLLVNDTDLRNSTYYHLYLAGEQAHPQAAVDRASAAFSLDHIELWQAQGESLIASRGAGMGLTAPEVANSRVVKNEGRAWLVAQQPLVRDNASIAWLRLGEPLERLFERRFGSGGDVEVKVANGGTAMSGVIRIPIDSEGGVSVDIRVPDTAGEALSEVKELLSKVLAISGIVMVLVFMFFLRWQLRPLMALHQATEAVGRGDFSIRLEPRGSREIAGLVTAFNRMAEGLRQGREMEQKLRHREQLSAIGRVAARVAHNINNPLTVIHNLARLMERQPESPANQEDIKSILHQSSRAIQTVEQLLDYGRPIQPRRERLLIASLCNEIALRWQKHSNIAVELKVDKDPPVSIDPMQFEELLENLLDNAREAAPEGIVVLQVACRDRRARVSVLDQGPGFSSDALTHKFEPFFTTKSSGSGLGLASAMAIVRVHGGDLEIGNREGHAEVIVWLPLDEESNGVKS